MQTNGLNRLFLVIALTICASTNVNAAWILGIGTESCEEMLVSISEDRSSGNTILPVETIYLTWIQGYFSGLNYNFERNKGEGIDQDMQVELVINRCQANPDQYIFEAVDNVWENDI